MSMFLGSVSIEEEGTTFERKSSLYPCLPFIANQNHALPSQNLLNLNGKTQGLIHLLKPVQSPCLCMIWIPLSSSPALAPCSLAAYKLLSELSAFPQSQYVMARIYLNSIPIEEKEKMESTQ